MCANRIADKNPRNMFLARMPPGLGVLVGYQRDWLRHDLMLAPRHFGSRKYRGRRPRE